MRWQDANFKGSLENTKYSGTLNDVLMKWRWTELPETIHCEIDEMSKIIKPRGSDKGKGLQWASSEFECSTH